MQNEVRHCHLVIKDNEDVPEEIVEKLTYTIFGDEYLQSKYPDNWQKKKKNLLKMPRRNE